MFKYPIIVFEGVEGSGKSYHIKNIQKYLKKKKIKFIKLREPGGSINSEKIRRIHKSLFPVSLTRYNGHVQILL